MRPLLWRASLGHLARHPLQLALAVLGIALGVAVVLAVELATGSARRAFELSVEQVAGRATHRIVGDRRGVPEALYTKLRVEMGLRRAAPVVTGYLELAGVPGRQVQLLGVDLFAETRFRPYLAQSTGDRGADPGRLLTEPGAALVSADLAAEVDGGDALTLAAGRRSVQATVLGTVASPGIEPRALVVTDISTAQEWLGFLGRLSHIDLMLPTGAQGEHQAALIAGGLPPSLRLEPAGAGSRGVGELSAAFELNLRAMSLLALLVGMFLIYNTMSFSVVQRRGLLGMLRVVGVSRAEIVLLILGEALLLGAAGTLLGCALGYWLGSGLVHLVSRTINDLYYALAVTGIHLSVLSVAGTGLLGLAATVLAALVPAREAARAEPGSLLSRSRLEGHRRGALRQSVGVALVLVVMGMAILVITRGLAWGFVAVFLFMLAATLCAPSLLVLLARTTQRITGRTGGLLLRMASRDIERSLSRTGVAAAALMVAFAAAVGVGVMIDSFRAGVAIWITDLVNADLYVAPRDGRAAGLDPGVLAVLGSHPDVASLSTYRRLDVPLAGVPVQLLAVELAPAARAGYRFSHGAPDEAWTAFAARDAVLVSEPLAYRHGLAVGERLILPTDRGEHGFRVAGIFHDYGSEHGRILIRRGLYRRFWDDPARSSAGLYAAPGRSAEDLRRDLETRLAGVQPLRFTSSAEIRAMTLAVFDRTFTITGVLRLLAVGVAFVGMLSALMALQLERARHLAVLRATGMSAPEIARLVTLETGFMGLGAGLAALPVGVGLGVLLIEVVNRRAFGWSMPLEVDPWLLAQTVLLAMLAALLAGIYPLWRMARTSPALALRTE